MEKYQPYTNLAQSYDTIVGDRSDEIQIIKQTIKKYTPYAKRLCEFGCGTGSLLAPFNNDGFDVYGVDASIKMVKEARKQVPNAIILNDDIRAVQLPTTMDVILSMYDTINHLLTLDDWRTTFMNIVRHINTNGMFFFDVNTNHRFNTLSEQSPIEHEQNEYKALFTINAVDEHMYQCVTDIYFNNGTHTTEYITEYTPSLNEIYSLLSEYFKEIKMTDIFGKTTDLETASKVYIVATDAY